MQASVFLSIRVTVRGIIMILILNSFALGQKQNLMHSTFCDKIVQKLLERTLKFLPTRPAGLGKMTISIPSQTIMTNRRAFGRAAGGWTATNGVQKVFAAQEGLVAGEVRFEGPDAEEAVQKSLALDGSTLGGSVIQVTANATYPNTVQVDGLSPIVSWRKLKDAFKPYGQVAFADVVGTGPRIGEVRFEGPDAEEAAQKSLALDGSMLGGSVIQVTALHSDPTRVRVDGLPSVFPWQSLKDAFKPYGQVAFVAVVGTGVRTGQVFFGGPDADEAAQKALALDGSMLGGNVIQVSINPTDPTKLLVDGLSPNILRQSLKDAFEPYGQVMFAAYAGTDLRTGHVLFRGPDAQEAAQKSLALDGSMLAGSVIQVTVLTANSTRVNVYGLSPFNRWQELKDAFKQYGNVSRAAIET